MNSDSQLTLALEAFSDVYYYEFIPSELVLEIDNYLSVEDSCNFQISDDPSECCIISTEKWVPKKRYTETNLTTVFAVCRNITEIVLIVKDLGTLFRHSHGTPMQIKDISLYHTNGYLGYLFDKIPTPMINQLETISLHVDIMRETLQELYLPCPVHDLFFAITNLHNAKFDTSIQISFCSATVQLPDDFFWNMLMSNMNLVIKEMSQIGAKAEFSIDPNEGYMDITVQHGKVDYCFAFFYFNPHIFEGEPSQVLNNVNDPTVESSSFFVNNSFIENNSDSDENRNLDEGNTVNPDCRLNHCSNNSYNLDSMQVVNWNSTLPSHEKEP